MTPKFMHAMTAKTIGAKRVRALLIAHPYLEQRAAQLSDLDRNLSGLCRMDGPAECDMMERLLQPFLEIPVSNVPTPTVSSSVPVAPAAEPKPDPTPRPAKKNPDGEMRQKIYDLILQHDDGVTSKTLSQACGIGDTGVHPHLVTLLNNHQIVRGSKPKGGQPYRYYARQNVPTATRSPEDIQSAYATQPVAARSIAPAPVAIPETREPPVVTTPSEPTLDDLELEMHALKTIITVLRPLERIVRDRVIQYVTGRFEVLA